MSGRGSGGGGRAGLAALAGVTLLAGKGGVVDVAVEMAVRGGEGVNGGRSEGDRENGEGGEGDEVEKLGGHRARKSERGY